MVRLAGDRSRTVRESVAGNQEVPTVALAQLSNDVNMWVRVQVAENVNTPPDALARLAVDPDYRVRWLARRNATTPDPEPDVPGGGDGPSTSPTSAEVGDADTTAAHMATSGDPSSLPDRLLELLQMQIGFPVRWRIARHPNAPPEALAQLARDADSQVRLEVAASKHTPSSVLAELAQDPDSIVRHYVARNATTPETTLAALAIDSDPSVRADVAANSSTPAATLATLIHDVDYTVQTTAVENANTPVGAIDLETVTQWAEAREPSTFLRRLAEHRDTSPELIAVLVHWLGADEGFAGDLLKNEKAIFSAEQLTNLASSLNAGIRMLAADRPNLPLPAQFRLSNDDYDGVREDLAGNEHSSAVILRKLSQDTEPTVRARVAANPSAPEDVMASLRQDSHDLVLCAAHGGGFDECAEAIE